MNGDDMMKKEIVRWTEERVIVKPDFYQANPEKRFIHESTVETTRDDVLVREITTTIMYEIE